MSRRNFAFELPIRGRGAGIATFRCDGKDCTATFQVSAIDGGRVNPECIANKAKQVGWQAHALAGPKTLCPDCLRRPSINDPDSELRKVKISMPVAPINGTPKLPPAVIEHAPAATHAAPAEPSRTVTHAQRMAIRDHLDKSFDDELGAYRAGMSDARVAELVGVARIHVETIRETAYGPIRVDPVMVALRDENVALKGEIAALRDMMDVVGKKSMELGSRIERALAGR
jgi:hypothetical protein